MDTVISSLPTMSLAHRRILLRIDGNVPLAHDTIIDDYRLQAIQPTLDFLLSHQAHVLLVTHIGRPKDKNPELSTRILVGWFFSHGYHPVFAQTIQQAEQLLTHESLVILENIRFWPGETTHDLTFAQHLKAITDVYVNDAFGTVHRTDTSISLLPSLYTPDNRTIGFLIQKELHALHQIMSNPKRPFIAVLGGAKLETKLPVITSLLKHADIIALLPALSNTFAYAHHFPIGASPYAPAYQEQALHIEQLAHQQGKHLLLPCDYLVAVKELGGPTRFCTQHEIAHNDFIVSIGPETLKQYQQHLYQARTIFFNGLAGDLNNTQTLEPMRVLFKSLCNSKALRIVAGGDSVAFIRKEQLTRCVDVLSTGGGATMQYLSKKTLPGLQLFIA